MKRREFVNKATLTGASIALLPTLFSCGGSQQAAEEGSTEEPTAAASSTFEQAPLGYDYAALEPHLDARTMEIHYSKHHAGYVKNLNKALETHPLSGKSLEEILAALTNSQADAPVVNNAGGHYNHSLFWEIMAPQGSNTPTGALAEALTARFNSYEAFLNEFTAAAGSVFGSGWAWLATNSDKNLFITTTQNQENPLMRGIVEQPGTPVLGIDVWEHAYYLKFQNRRPEYISSFIKVINWDAVGARFAQTQS